MNELVMKSLSRFLALFIALALTFPNPAVALRQTGLEESPEERQNLVQALQTELVRTQGPVAPSGVFPGGQISASVTSPAAGAEEGSSIDQAVVEANYAVIRGDRFQRAFRVATINYTTVDDSPPALYYTRIPISIDSAGRIVGFGDELRRERRGLMFNVTFRLQNEEPYMTSLEIGFRGLSPNEVRVPQGLTDFVDSFNSQQSTATGLEESRPVESRIDQAIPAAGAEEGELYDGFTAQGTGVLASDRWIRNGLVRSGERRGVVGLLAAAGLEGIRVFLHPEFPGKDFGGLEEVRFPGEPVQARAFLQEVGLAESDLIVLPLSVAAGLEQEWRPDGSRTPIVVMSAGGLEEATPRELTALGLIAKRLEGQVLRVGLEEWNQRMTSEEHFSLQY